MNPERRGEVRILFGDPGQGTRRLYRQALVAGGYTQLREFDNLAGFADLLAVAQPDLILMDTAMPGGDPAALISELRHNRLGVNPFLPVMLTTWDTAQSLVRKFIDAGADDLLVKPLSTRSLLDRVETVSLHRKPFVVTSDYIGPDRRKEAARRASNVPFIEVPNVIRAKLEGEPLDGQALQQAIRATNEQVNRQRLRAAAFRIAFVTQQIVPLYQAGTPPDEATLTMLRELVASVEDIRQRIASTDLAHVGQICDRLLQPARQMADYGVAQPFDAEWQKTFSLMKTLGDAVLAFFNPDRDASVLAGEVAEAIDRFRARKAAQAAGQIPQV